MFGGVGTIGVMGKKLQNSGGYTGLSMDQRVGGQGGSFVAVQPHSVRQQKDGMVEHGVEGLISSDGDIRQEIVESLWPSSFVIAEVAAGVRADGVVASTEVAVKGRGVGGLSYTEEREGLYLERCNSDMVRMYGLDGLAGVK